MPIIETPTNVAALAARLIRPDRGDFSAEAARAVLGLRFDADDEARMRALSLKAQGGDLTAAERDEIQSDRRVGYFLGTLWSKARLSLKSANAERGDGPCP